MLNVFIEIHYNTQWGEQIFVEGKFNGSENREKLPLVYNPNGLWTLNTTVKQNSLINYQYILLTSDGISKKEPVQRYFTAEGKNDIYIYDQWLSPDTDDSILYRSISKNAIFKKDDLAGALKNNIADGIYFQISVPRVKNGYKICVTGNIPELGDWDQYKPLLLESAEFANWFGGFGKMPKTGSIEYKYAVYDLQSKRIVEWEAGENRKLTVKNQNSILKGDSGFRFSFPWKGSGIAIPVFSIRTEAGLGIGEFNDLKIFGDWVAKTGMNLIQILPINDTISKFDWTDSYPYNAISVYALNPIYINLDELFKHDNTALSFLKHKKKELNTLAEIDFEAVLDLKMEYLHKAFDFHKGSLEQDKDFQLFLEKNGFWVKAYALFCCLRDRYKTTDFSKWGQYAEYSEEMLDKCCDSGEFEMCDAMFYVFIQYHLDKQLASSIEYLHNHGIALKGDIPIGINRESVDAWASPELFNFNQQTGAPPDYFSTVGQNWGFPTYNWEQMKKDEYEWWQNRFRKMADYFDAYRIDHILGFFRIWEIPFRFQEGLMGHFSPALPYTAEDLWFNKLPFDPKWWCTPHVYKYESYIFGDYTEEILEHFFEQEGDLYYLKEEHNETRQLFSKCHELGIVDDNIIYKLRDVICDVLFMEDERQKGYYHPRIELQRTRKFHRLADDVKHNLMLLYNDFFYKRHNQFWKDKALEKLPRLIHTTNMLVCGEDLGMIPDNVPEVMNQLNILTLDIQNMPKINTIEFSDPRWFKYYSVCTTSTHDTPTLRGVWKYDPEKGKRMVNSLCHEDVQTFADCPGWLCKKIIEVNLQAGSALTILPLQDWLSINERLRYPDPHAERINKPEYSRHYWRYRMHIPVETLLNEDELTDEIHEMIRNSDRIS
ncbi:4-alpha-glucanotransferase [Saccharicrinis sp. FJH2]|uniref:4-alpha-glucanotransferase n=1 Tax=Saccharicrinis sp. FJH65 TaxID=3344659 RepID=UPI0035F2D2ED